MMQEGVNLEDLEGTRELGGMERPSSRPEVDELLNPKQQ